MANRSYGWIQNPGKFDNLQHVVQILDSNSIQYKLLRDKLVPELIFFKDIKSELLSKLQANISTFTYSELVGSAKDKYGNSVSSSGVGRKGAMADGLIQVTIPSQNKSKPWTDNWTSDGYLRWAVSLNFARPDERSSEFEITQLGALFSKAHTEKERDTILARAFLSYPPATRILSILSQNIDHSLSKFQLGHKLGFYGEPGFTSYSNKLMQQYLKSAQEKKEISKIKSDIEGTSDKYARMISKWLSKVGYVEIHGTKIRNDYGEIISGFPTYSITGKGLHALNQSIGKSKNNRVSKFVRWEFFATTGKNRDYLRFRRAKIIKILMHTPRKSLQALMANLKAAGINDSINVIKNDVLGLSNCGIRVSIDGNYIELKDKIQDFPIPTLNINNVLKDKHLEKIKEKFLENTSLDPRFISLIEISRDKKQNRAFEVITAELFNTSYNLSAIHLGGGRRPDVLVYNDNFGIIIDTKAYKDGYGRNVNQEDEMVRYITENNIRKQDISKNNWWKYFSKSIPSTSYYHLWISSEFVGMFSDQLRETSSRTGENGGAMNVEQLLIGANQVLNNVLDPNRLPEYMKNQEIIFGTL